MADETRTTLASAPRVAARDTAAWALRVVFSPDPALREGLVPLAASGVRIGRRPEGALAGRCAISDPRLSRQHAAVQVLDDETLVVRDLDSRNGTSVDGRRVARAEIGAGAVIRVGDTLLVPERRARGLADPAASESALAGSTPPAVALRALVARVAPSALSVLVVGASGTGKELVARGIHRLSGRAGAFVALNCAALPEALVENALFGHQRGAYTHATTSEVGAFVAAEGGTLFLDEVGEMALAAQPKLLRVLEDGEVTPVGGTRPRRVDVRVVSATNRDLEADLAAGRFRPDLYARLCGVVIRAPLLQERRGDVVALFRRFLPPVAAGRPVTADFAEALLLWSWPLNVRELRQLAERLAVLHPDAAAWELAHLDPAMRPEAPAPDTASADAEGPMTREALVDLLARYDGNVSRVAEVIGRNRRQVYRWMDRLGIVRGAGRAEDPE